MQSRPATIPSYKFPSDWAPERRVAFNLGQYEKYISMMHDVAGGTLAIRDVYFVQPCPAIGKTLTADEKRVVGKLDYAEVYQRMTDELLTLNGRGIPVVSLLDCFDGVDETVYADIVHCDTNGSGYRIMSERIADELARLWNVPEK